MDWVVEFHDDFAAEFAKLDDNVRIEAAAMIGLLKQFGPELKRPHADTLTGSDYANMKELRFYADDGAWRIAFAFDPARTAILLVGGDKSGGPEKRFYKTLIRKADQRFAQHLEELKQKGGV